MRTKNGSYCEKEKKVMRVGRGVRVDVNGEVEFLFGGGGGGGGGVRSCRGGGQGGCVRRSEAFLKIQNKIFIFFSGGGGGGSDQGLGWGRGVPRFGLGGCCGVWGM